MNPFLFWVKEISPNVAPYSHQLNLKLVENPFKRVRSRKYRIYLRGLDKAIGDLSEENIPLFTEMASSRVWRYRG